MLFAGLGHVTLELARTSIDQLKAPGVGELLISLFNPRKAGDVNKAVIAKTGEAIQAIEILQSLNFILTATGTVYKKILFAGSL